MTLERGGLSLHAEGDGVTLAREGFYECPMSLDDLRWLCMVAGPALLVEHDPHPAVERARGTATGPLTSEAGPATATEPPPAEQPVDVIVPEQEHEPLTLNIEPEAE